VSTLPWLLRSHREAAGLTQEELAARAGVSARTVSDIERGLRSRLYPDTAERFVTALGLTSGPRDAFLHVARGHRLTQPVVPRIPEPLTRLVGRDHELANLIRLSAPGGSRLVTLTGLGGIGKTRLALAATRQLAEVYRGRVALVEVPPNLDESMLMSTVTAALGATRRAGRDTIAMIVGDRPTLLLLDAFEHVLDAAGAVESLLLDIPALHLLVTSRVRLGITGEHEIVVRPLAPPAASELFLARAREADAGVGDDPALIAEICDLLSGFPLALELAAARTRHLPLPALRDRLRSGVTDVLAADDSRRRSLGEALSWAVSSLQPEEQTALRAAALFPGGWSLPAMERLCGPGALDAISELVDNGLVVLDGGSFEEHRQSRWRMYDVVREHVLAPGADGANEAMVAAYLAHYLELLANATEIVGQERDWFRLLATEESNVRTALVWAGDRGDTDALLRLAGGMWLYWQAVGALTEGRMWLERGLAARPPADPQQRMTALWGLGWLAYHQGDVLAARSASEQLGSLATAHNDNAARRNAATLSGMVAIAEDRTDDAIRDLEVALAIAQELDRPWILATSLLNLGMARTAAEDFDGARDAIGDALRHYAEIDDQRFQARSRGYLGLVSLSTGDLSQANTLFAQSLRAFHALAEPGGTAEGLTGLAAVAAALGDASRAATLIGAAQRLRQSIAGSELPLERRAMARHIDQARESIDPGDWATALKRGRELSLDVAVARHWVSRRHDAFRLVSALARE
jgi:predicted ATPase/transcriptional regulator with XRE-family HTH domain